MWKYCKCGNFHVGVIFPYNRSNIVKITTWKVLPTFSQNPPPSSQNYHVNFTVHVWNVYSISNTLNLKTISEDLVYKELCGINVSKSTGLDEIPGRFIKDGATLLKKPITSIINQSIMSGIVPTSMKQARVKPLYKKNSSLDVSNYRPVSIIECGL